MTIRQNPDADYARKIRTKLRDNDGYCPCRLEKTDDTKCICKEFREQIKNGSLGACHCGLYIVEAE